MRVTVFGATGGTGRQVVRRALAAGHEVTAVVRGGSRLEVADHALLRVVTADPMDPAAAEGAVRGGDAVVSALGPRGRAATTVCSDGARSITAGMRAAGVGRLVVVTASGPVVDEGDGPFSRALVKPILARYLRGPFADFPRTEGIVRASGLDWTVLRPPRLTDGRSRPYRSAVDRNVRGGFTLARTDLARAVLAALADPTTIGHTVGLGY